MNIVRFFCGLCSLRSNITLIFYFSLYFSISLHRDERKTYFLPLTCRLTCEKDNSKHNVDFRCTFEQLQDLVAKLKDASASLDRLDMYAQESL